MVHSTSIGACKNIWEFPNFGVQYWGVPIVMLIIFLGSILGSPYFGKPPYTPNTHVNTCLQLVC